MSVVSSLSVRIGADVGPLKSGLAQANQQVTGFGGQVKSKLDAIGLGGALALTAVTGAAVQFGAQSVRAAVSFDEAMTNTNSILKLSQAEIGELSSDILDFGANTRAGPQAVAEAFYEIVGGVADASTHMAILEASTRTAEAGNADLTGTTSALIAVMNSYAFGADKAAFVSDVLTQTVGAGVGSMDEFAAAMGMNAGLAASTGVEFDALGGSMAWLTTQGFSASQAGTRLTSVMTAFLKPNKEMQSALKAMGLESGSAGLEMYGLAGMTGRLQEALGGSTDSMSAALGTTEALTAAIALNKPGFEAFIGNFEDAAEGATDAARAIQNASTAASFDRLNAQVDRLKIGFGSLVIPVLEGAANVVVSGIQAGADLLTEAGALGATIGEKIRAGLDAGMTLGDILMGVDPSKIIMLEETKGSIRTAIDEHLNRLAVDMPTIIKMSGKRYQLMGDVADDINAVISMQIAGTDIKPISLIVDTLLSALPPEASSIVSAMNDMVSVVTGLGLSPTERLQVNAWVDLNVESDDAWIADFKRDFAAQLNPGMATLLAADSFTEGMQVLLPTDGKMISESNVTTWFDTLKAQMQSAIDLASQNPLTAAFDVDATLDPTVNRTTTDPVVDTAVKTYATTALKDTEVLTPADLTVTPTLANAPQVTAEIATNLGALNYDTPAGSVISIMTSLGNGPEVQSAIRGDLSALNYDAQATANVRIKVNTFYEEHPEFGGPPRGQLTPPPGYSRGGYTGDGPAGEVAGVVHRGEYVLSRDMLRGMSGGGGATPAMATGGGRTVNVFVTGEFYGEVPSEFIEKIKRGLREAAA